MFDISIYYRCILPGVQCLDDRITHVTNRTNHNPYPSLGPRSGMLQRQPRLFRAQNKPCRPKHTMQNQAKDMVRHSYKDGDFCPENHLSTIHFAYHQPSETIPLTVRSSRYRICRNSKTRMARVLNTPCRVLNHTMQNQANAMADIRMSTAHLARSTMPRRSISHITGRTNHTRYPSLEQRSGM